LGDSSISRDEVHEIATDIIATSTTKLTRPSRLAHFTRFARPSLKMRFASLRSAQMHIYEFLICVANAMTDFVARNSFVHTILSESIEQWAGAECGAFFASVESLLGCMGVSGSANNPNFVVNMAEITKVSGIYGKVFLPLSTLMSVGKRCEESSRDRNEENLCNSSVCLTDLSKIDPYVQFWPRILPQVTQVLKTTMSVWHHSVRKMLLKVSESESER